MSSRSSWAGSLVTVFFFESLIRYLTRTLLSSTGLRIAPSFHFSNIRYGTLNSIFDIRTNLWR